MVIERGEKKYLARKLKKKKTLEEDEESNSNQGTFTKCQLRQGTSLGFTIQERRINICSGPSYVAGHAQSTRHALTHFILATVPTGSQ